MHVFAIANWFLYIRTLSFLPSTEYDWESKYTSLWLWIRRSRDPRVGSRPWLVYLTILYRQKGKLRSSRMFFQRMDLWISQTVKCPYLRCLCLDRQNVWVTATRKWLMNLHSKIMIMCCKIITRIFVTTRHGRALERCSEEKQ